MADYYYSSARVRALEASLIGRDRIARLLEAKDSREIYSLLEEYGVPAVEDEVSGRVDREETLLQILTRTYSEIETLTEAGTLFRIFLYPYDCNNIKACIKAKIRKISPTSMLFPFGTVSVRALEAMPDSEDFSALPSHMAAAAAEAVRACSATGNPQTVDLILDRACYRDMLEAATSLGNAYAMSLVRSKIDLVNLMMTVRVLRMSAKEMGRLWLSDSLLAGGTVETEFFLSGFEQGEDYLWDRLSYGEYTRLARAVVESDRSLRVIERLCDDAWMDRVRQAKMVPSGAEVLIGYLIANEYAVKNIRIILAGKDAGLSNEKIRERIRESYV